jgi:hypothetical protein
MLWGLTYAASGLTGRLWAGGGVGVGRTVRSAAGPQHQRAKDGEDDRRDDELARRASRRVHVNH